VGFLWRAILVLAVFVGVGYAVDHAVKQHSRHAGTPESQVRLSAAMAGLFTGGAAASAVLLAVAFSKQRSENRD
jgi:hypothetical protein